ncbi:hypothetical protein R3P38DRAFT_2807493 [Favolaschia claudopus]|uniref:Tc1-like transposase DDE domain-containing protein n=1 Tax=Favolaschia claudopus TaxID=2862362 RepID=A0AAV9ZHV7_9AGAR
MSAMTMATLTNSGSVLCYDDFDVYSMGCYGGLWRSLAQFQFFLMKEGYLAAKVIPGAFDSWDFFDFVAEQVITSMNAWPQKHSVLVLDNCRIHHNEALLDLLQANLKAYMRRHGAEMLAANDPVGAILEATACITAGKAQNWFHHAGYH